MSTRTASPAECWFDLGTYSVRVVRRMVNRRRRYLASVYAGDQRDVGLTVFGNYPSAACAVASAKLLVECAAAANGETVCNWSDAERVRAELAKGRQ